MLLSLQNNERRYAEFQFLLTGDLSSLKRSGVDSESVKGLRFETHTLPQQD